MGGFLRVWRSMRIRVPVKKPLRLSPFPFILLVSACLFLIFLYASSFATSIRKRTTTTFSNGSEQRTSRTSAASCDYSKGRWVYDPQSENLYDNTCKEIFKGWNCIANNKSNALDLTKWRWQPYDCDLHRLDPVQFLNRFRNTNIGFVGDSLNRNMFVSLVCMLRRASNEVRKWRPAKADRGFTFLKYNLTIAYHRTNLLARYTRWSASANGGVLESLGYRNGFRVDVDVPDSSWSLAPTFHDILILNTGHWWWAPSKFDPQSSPMLFFEKGLPVIPPKLPEIGLDMTLKHMILFVERRMGHSAILFFRTQSPRHFEGGDWNEGGFCRRTMPLPQEQVDQLFSLENNGTNIEARLSNEHMYRAVEGTSFQILDISHVSEYRADAHPSRSGGKKHEDCMHWCLPGIADTWNDLLVAHLNRV